MTGLLVAAVLSFAAQLALQAPGLWWFMAAARPYLVVLVASSTRFGPFGVAWFGLALGLVADLLDDAIVGPRGIAGAVAGLAVAVVVRRFELEGPLFWIGGTALATAANDLAFRVVVASLGVSPSWSWVGSLATVVATGAVALAVAAGAAVRRKLLSPEHRRRKVLKRL